MIRVESVGSIWLFDEDLKRYMRMPKTEAPRERKPYYDQHESLDDLVWHEYARYLVRDGWLRIILTDADAIVAPIARPGSGVPDDVWIAPRWHGDAFTMRGAR